MQAVAAPIASVHSAIHPSPRALRIDPGYMIRRAPSPPFCAGTGRCEALTPQSHAAARHSTSTLLLRGERLPPLLAPRARGEGAKRGVRERRARRFRDVEPARGARARRSPVLG